jgi:hypothetical protein
LLFALAACYNPRVAGIDHFEALIQHLVEGTFGRLFPPPLQSGDLVRGLWRAMDSGRQMVGGQVVFPNGFRILLNPADHAALVSGQSARLEDDIDSCLQRLAREARGRFSGDLITTIAPTPGLPPGKVEVRAAHVRSPVIGAAVTREMDVASNQMAEAGQWTIRSDMCTYRLGEPVICVGRALSNDIILDDRRVSRRHARLRWHDGRYHLSDAGSREGVSVNGQPLPPGVEYPLVDGDRIDLAGLLLIFERDGSAPLELRE